jgi:hypothetical protein
MQPVRRPRERSVRQNFRGSNSSEGQRTIRNSGCNRPGGKIRAAFSEYNRKVKVGEGKPVRITVAWHCGIVRWKLERCGDGKGYLNETRSVSVRPPGLRIRRAEAGTKRTLRPRCSVSQRKPETFFLRLSHRASEMKGFGPGLSETDARSSGKCALEPERHFVPESRLGGRKDSRKVLL